MSCRCRCSMFVWVARPGLTQTHIYTAVNHQCIASAAYLISPILATMTCTCTHPPTPSVPAGEAVLHRADSHSLAHAFRRRLRAPHRPLLPACAGVGGRAYQPRGMALVPRREPGRIWFVMALMAGAGGSGGVRRDEEAAQSKEGAAPTASHLPPICPFCLCPALRWWEIPSAACATPGSRWAQQHQDESIDV